MSAAFQIIEPFSRLTPRPVAWLWTNRLALGKLAVFDGDPVLGKSMVTLDLCARITTGRPFPDGSPPVTPANVLILNGEDAAEDTILPRLQALGADLDRAFLLRKDFLDRAGPFRIPSQTAFLDQALEESAAVLAVIDPVMAFLDPAVQVASDVAVRQAFSPLAAIAERRRCHILLVRHLNKSAGFHSLYRGGGSIGILAACRAAFLFARDPADPLRAVMAQIKNNNAPPQPSLAYRIHAPEPGRLALDWLGSSSLAADQLLAAAGAKPYLPGPRDRARDFLFAFLDDGPKTTLEIWPAAAKLRISQRTLQRVSRKIPVQSCTRWVDNRQLTFWALPGHNLPPDPGRPSLEPWLTPLREQYPKDPLDDDP